MNESFANRLRTLRKSRRLTMKEVATKLGVPSTTYREWEYGRSIQGAEPYLKLAEVLAVSLRELLGGAKSDSRKIWRDLEAAERHLAEVRKELSSYL